MWLRSWCGEPPRLPGWSASVPRNARTSQGGWLSWATTLVLLSVCQIEAATALPIEVMGAPGTTVTVTLQVPSGSQASSLKLRLHGVNYQTKASVKLNAGAWTAISNATATVADPAQSFGGIGGGFSTIDLTLPVSGGLDGANELSFRFNAIQLDSSGYRVLAVDLRNSSGASLLTAGQFTDDDPALWSPPLPSAADIAAGEAAWSGAPLVAQPGGSAIQARCSDCHASNGYDLKYFNYSNLSIIERAKFHGLSPLQGSQIASFIRSLNAPNPGRPWNPPFQPGPGLDAKPASAWSAGAGLDQGLISEDDSRAQLPGGGVVSGAIADAYTDGVSLRTLNRRELPIALQFPDWNRWLPRTHPVDVIGSRSAWEATDLAVWYNRLHDRLSGTAAYGFGITSPDQYLIHPLGLSLDLATWNKGMAASPFADAAGPFNKGPDNIQQWHEALAQMGVRSAMAVRLWELHQEFGLYELLQKQYGIQAEPRMMMSYRTLFNLSPAVADFNNLFNLHGDSPAQPANQAIASQWYELQIVVNGGARNNPNGGFHVVDWGYMSGIFNGELRVANQPSPTRAALFALKAIQEHDNGYAPNGPGRPGEEQNPWWAFNWRDNVAQMDWASMTKMAQAVSSRNAHPMVEDVRRIWLEQVGRYNERQWDEGLYWGGGGTYGTSARTYRLGTNSNPELEAPDRLLSEIRALRTNYPQLSHAIVNAHAEIGRWLWPGPKGANIATWSAERRVDGTRAAPGEVTASGDASSITVRWTAVPGALSYNVKRLEGAQMRAVPVRFMIAGTSWTDIQRPERTAISYVVSANFAHPVSGNGPLEGPDSLPASATPQAGLVSRWRFDEASGLFLDSGPAANHATGISLSGSAAVRVTGRLGSALSTDRADHVHRYAATKRSFHETIAGTMTWAAWFRTHEALPSLANRYLPGIAGVVSTNLPQASDALVLGQLQSNGRIGVMVGATGTPLTTPAAVNDNQWHHLAIVRNADSGLVQLYLDGALAASATLAPGRLATRCSSLGRIDGTRAIFPGAIDDLRLYDRQLGAAEIAAIHARAAADGIGIPVPDLLVADARGAILDGDARTIDGTSAGRSRTGSLTLANLGSGLLLCTQTVTALDAVNCTGAATAPGAPGIAAGGSGQLSFHITPLAPGPWSVRLVLASNDPDDPAHDILLAGTASAAGAGGSGGSGGGGGGGCGIGSAAALAIAFLVLLMRMRSGRRND